MLVKHLIIPFVPLSDVPLLMTRHAKHTHTIHSLNEYFVDFRLCLMSTLFIFTACKNESLKVRCKREKKKKTASYGVYGAAMGI